MDRSHSTRSHRCHALRELSHRTGCIRSHGRSTDAARTTEGAIQMTPDALRTDRDALEYFRQERARLEQDPLWRAAWKTAEDQGKRSFRFDGVEWPV